MNSVILGDVFFDIILKVNPSNLGLIQGGTSYCNQIFHKPGGIGNVAVGLSRLGGKSQFIGKVGTDSLGGLYQTALSSEGVGSKLFFDAQHPTGILLSFIDSNSERSFLIFRGANDFFCLDEIKQCEDEISKSNLLHICGCSFVNNPQRSAIFKAVELAKENNIKVLFDPGSYNLILEQRSFFNKILDLCDALTINFDEAKALTNCETLRDVVSSLSKKVPFIALKLGAKGCIIANLKKKVICPAYKVNVIDSSGAGDAFASALIFGLQLHFSLESIGKFANWYASNVIQDFGAWTFPSKEEIKQHLLTTNYDIIS